MTIKLNDLSGIANIIKTKYGQNLHQMNFIFCFKKDPKSYFIFQEIQGMPIKRIVYHKENNSITFVASWASWNNPYALIADANFEQIENWKDLQDRSRPYNSYIEEGGFNKSQWQWANKMNMTEKKKRHKNKSDVFVEFRIDRIQRANFNNWGFELYSDTISMIGFISRLRFPYDVRDIQQQNNNTPPIHNNDTLVHNLNLNGFNQHDISSHKITWQGGSFYIPEFEKNSEDTSLVHSSGPNGMQGYSLESYWSSEEADEKNDQFDEEIADMLLDDRIDDDTIFEIGQRKVNLYFDE